MRRFLYYFPGRTGMNPGLLARYGLLDRFEAVRGELLEHVITAVAAGPDGAEGKGGCIVGVGSKAVEFAPSRQTWCKAWGGSPEQGGWFWVGVEQPWPVAEDLIREVVISGPTCQLADGKAWRVPVLHRWNPETMAHVPNLPTALRPRPDGSGRLEKAVRPEFAAADVLARTIWADFVASRPVPAEGSFARAVQVLAVNYRIGPEECGLLGVMNEGDVERLLAAAVDVPTIQNEAAQESIRGLEYVEPVIRDEE